MTDQPIFHRINELASEEEQLWQRAAAGGGLSTADQERLDEIKVALDQCYDLLHQRNAQPGLVLHLAVVERQLAREHG